MTTLAELGLTPSQYAEIERCDQDLVQAWLEELDTTRTKIKSPVGWFLAAVRSGSPPGTTFAGSDPRVHQAENWIRNVGRNFFQGDEQLVADHLFDDRGIIRNCQDQQLRVRLLSSWRSIASPDPDVEFAPELPVVANTADSDIPF